MELRCNPDPDTEESEVKAAEDEQNGLSAEHCAKIEIDGDGYVTVYSDENVTVESPTINLKGNSVNVTTDQFNVKATAITFDSVFQTETPSKSLTVSTKAFDVTASENIKFKSRAMEMDAREGSFTARGKFFPPIVAM